MFRKWSALAVALVACAKSDKTGSSDSTAASSTQASTQSSAACAADNGGITLPAGFCATVFADSLGHPRDIVIASNGDAYVNTWSGQYFNTPAPAGGFIVALRDTNNDGKADVIKRFGPDARQKNGGGTGIALYNGSLYVEEGDTASKRIVRYPVSTDSMVPTSAKSELIVNKLPASGDHPMHPFVIDGSGNIFMDVGSATNSCQAKNRTANSAGQKPCVELQTRGGIWRYAANKTNQQFSSAGRYATGIRNAVGIALDGSGQLYSTQHGRDQLAENWSKLFTPEQGQNLPAEELLKIEQVVITVGRTATSMGSSRTSSYSLPSTVATARRWETAPERKPPKPGSPPTGRPTDWSSTPARNIQRTTRAAPSSRSTAPGTGRLASRGATRSSSSPSPAANQRTGRNSRISRTDSSEVP